MDRWSVIGFPVLSSDGQHPCTLLDQQFYDIEPEFLMGKSRCENARRQFTKSMKDGYSRRYCFKDK